MEDKDKNKKKGLNYNEPLNKKRKLSSNSKNNEINISEEAEYSSNEENEFFKIYDTSKFLIFISGSQKIGKIILDVLGKSMKGIFSQITAFITKTNLFFITLQKQNELYEVIACFKSDIFSQYVVNDDLGIRLDFDLENLCTGLAEIKENPIFCLMMEKSDIIKLNVIYPILEDNNSKSGLHSKKNLSISCYTILLNTPLCFGMHIKWKKSFLEFFKRNIITMVKMDFDTFSKTINIISSVGELIIVKTDFDSITFLSDSTFQTTTQNKKLISNLKIENLCTIYQCSELSSCNPPFYTYPIFCDNHALINDNIFDNKILLPKFYPKFICVDCDPNQLKPALYGPKQIFQQEDQLIENDNNIFILNKTNPHKKSFKPIRCELHKKLDDLPFYICHHEECSNLATKIPSKNSKRSIRCIKHSLSSDVYNGKPFLCTHKGCQIGASYSENKIKTPILCEKHATNMTSMTKFFTLNTSNNEKNDEEIESIFLDDFDEELEGNQINLEKMITKMFPSEIKNDSEINFLENSDQINNLYESLNESPDNNKIYEFESKYIAKFLSKFVKIKLLSGSDLTLSFMSEEGNTNYINNINYKQTPNLNFHKVKGLIAKYSFDGGYVEFRNSAVLSRE